MTTCRILIVDNSPKFLAAAGDFLADSGRVEVVGRATSGREGLELASRLRPDLILMDLSMPGMDGLEAGRRIAGSAHAPPVVIMTVHEEPAYRLAAERSGAAGFLVKSRLAEDLLSLIGDLMPAPGESPAGRDGAAPPDFLPPADGSGRGGMITPTR